LKPWFETKNRFQTEVKPKHKVTLSFGFKPYLPLKPKFETKVLVSNQT